MLGKFSTIFQLTLSTTETQFAVTVLERVNPLETGNRIVCG